MDVDDHDLDIDDRLPSEAKPGTALARAKALSLALSDAARRARLSTRRARQMSSGGFQNRRGAKHVRWLLTGSFVALFVAPTLGAILYLGLIASDQYVAQAEFTVSAGESPLKDGDSFSGPPAQLILQDTQVIANFIHSREIVDKLEGRIGLRKIYSRAEADWFARFNAEKPVERLVKYWAKVSAASIKLPGGIVKFNVRAFTPEDAKLVADSTLSLCEDLVNEMNARINRDAVALAEESMSRATQRLAKTLAAQEVARNQFGVVQPNLSAQAVTGLLRELKTTLLEVSGSYDAHLRDMKADTPQMRELKARIDVLKRQVAELEAQLTTRPGVAAQNASLSGDATVSAAMTTLGALDVEQKADEQLYENAATALEHARIASDFRMIYLKIYVRPSLPQESEYPERGLDVTLIAAASLALWGVLVALGAAVRNNMA